MKSPEFRRCAAHDFHPSCCGRPSYCSLRRGLYWFYLFDLFFGKSCLNSSTQVRGSGQKLLCTSTVARVYCDRVDCNPDTRCGKIARLFFSGEAFHLNRSLSLALNLILSIPIVRPDRQTHGLDIISYFISTKQERTIFRRVWVKWPRRTEYMYIYIYPKRATRYLQHALP